jgi:choline dehydrogenase-like flavoprotein
MILDAAKDLPLTPAPYDVCIVGAGAAGISLALQLDATRSRVCLLEAGGCAYERATQELFSGDVAAAQYPILREARLGALGGTTNVWAGWCRPLEELDFKQRDTDPASGWPFGLDELRPYYELAHALCGLGDFAYDSRHWERVLAARPLLAGDADFTNRIFHIYGQQFGSRYRRRLQQSRNIDLILHAPVSRVVMNEAGCRAEQVRVRTLNGRRIAIAAKRIVLAAGGIENPRLLLLSGNGPEQAPGNARDLVGRYFTDHPFVDPGTLVCRGTKRTLDYYLPAAVAATDGRTSVRGVLSLRREVLERERLLNAALFFYPRYESHRAFATAEVKAFLQIWEKLRKRGVPGGAWPHVARAARAPHWIALAMLRKAAVRNGPAARWRVRAMFETEPRYENRVVLTNETDAIGRHRPRVEWRLGERDLSNMSRVTALFDKAVRRSGIGHLERAFPDESSAWERAVEGGKHHMGTTRMHVDARFGVVDENSRVHGVTNLYVIGSSVFPSPGYANPTLTIVALAIRLGDHLKSKA